MLSSQEGYKRIYKEGNSKQVYINVQFKQQAMSWWPDLQSAENE